jgi:hypothetical protein
MATSVVQEYASQLPPGSVWMVGNELETMGDQTTAFNLINTVAAAVAAADPTRPIGTAIADVGTNKASQFQQICTNLHILGINTYGEEHGRRAPEASSSLEIWQVVFRGMTCPLPACARRSVLTTRRRRAVPGLQAPAAGLHGRVRADGVGPAGRVVRRLDDDELGRADRAVVHRQGGVVHLRVPVRSWRQRRA